MVEKDDNADNLPVAPDNAQPIYPGSLISPFPDSVVLRKKVAPAVLALYFLAGCGSPNSIQRPYLGSTPTPFALSTKGPTWKPTEGQPACFVDNPSLPELDEFGNPVGPRVRNLYSLPDGSKVRIIRIGWSDEYHSPYAIVVYTGENGKNIPGTEFAVLFSEMQDPSSGCE